MPTDFPEEGKQFSGDSVRLTDASTPSPPAPPDVPDYELLRRIGGGSYGEVWLARNVLGDYRAVKVIYRKNFEHDRPYDREFEGIQKFEPISRSHESQVDILHVGRNDAAGYFYYVMELADQAKPGPNEGEGASSRAVDAESRGSSGVSPSRTELIDPVTYVPHTLKLDLYHRGRLPADECIQICLALTTALQHLHEHGLVHRDIKPSNIIFVNGVPKLADIGLVASMDATMSFVGTSGFLPPEGPGTTQADIYSLGKVLYEISMGRDRQEFPKLPANLTEFEEPQRLLELNAVILKACHRDPRQRYQSAAEMQRDLALLQSGQSVRRKRVLGRRWLMARRVCLVMAVLAAVTVAGWLLITRFGLRPGWREIAQHADSLAMTGTKNLEAYELYVKARVCLRRFTIEGEKLARQYLEEAVKVDPNFLPAYELLFESYGESWLEEANAGMRATAKKLMELKPDSAPAQWVTAVVKFHLDFEFAEAEQGFRRAVRIDPNNALAHVVYGWYLAMIGRTSAARKELQRSANLDPGYPVAEQLLGDSYCVDRGYGQALASYQKALALAPNFLLGHERAGRACEAQGDYLKAINHFQKLDLIVSESGEKGTGVEEIAKITQRYDALREAFKQSGPSGYWQKRLDQIQYPENRPFEVAAIFAQLGNREKALQWLAAAYTKRDKLNYLLFDHRFDSLHHERRFQELLKKVGYPDSKL